MLMKHLKTFYTEAAYALGMILLSAGVACMIRADFGLSMVAAPAYLVYLKLSDTVSFLSYGMTEYILQALILILKMVWV